MRWVYDGIRDASDARFATSSSSTCRRMNTEVNLTVILIITRYEHFLRVTSSRLNDGTVRNSPLNAFTVKPLSSTSGLLPLMIQRLGSAHITSHISFAPSAEILSSHPLATRHARASSMSVGTGSSRTTMSASRCTRVTLTVKRVT